jgi:predicted Zn-dependent peptidase
MQVMVLSHTTFDLNGITLLVETLPHTHSVSLGCFVAVGSGYESSATTGASHFIEHLLFKGSHKFPTPKQIAAAVEGVGGLLDAYTDFESTVYYAKVADIHVERAATLLGDMLTNPIIAAQDIEKERRVIIEELRETADAPSEYIQTVLDLAMWGDQPLGHDIAGNEARLATLDRAALVMYWKQHYHRQNLVISIAGNIQPETALALIQQAFAGIPTGEQQPLIATLPPKPGPQVVIEQADTEQANFVLGFPGIAKDDPDRRAMLVFDTIVGGGMASRLVQEIREERGLAYTIGSESQEYHDAGKWLIYGSVDPAKLSECLLAIMAELRRIRSEGITAEELAQVKEQVKGGILLSLEDTWSVAARNGTHQLLYGYVIPLEQVVAEVEAVTAADVHRVARRIVREEGLHLAVMGPISDRTGLEQLLTLEH